MRKLKLGAGIIFATIRWKKTADNIGRNRLLGIAKETGAAARNLRATGKGWRYLAEKIKSGYCRE